ncbi:MAG: prepilin peptidase [Chloroflexi bacterium]|nr:prepilin peptidase [Chloroflexota bacterium]
MGLLVAYAGMMGLAVGSFLGLVADRLPRGESIVTARSRCGSCGRVLAWWELVPVISYLALGGRCSGCRARIPMRLLAVEVGTGALFAATSLRYGASLETVVTLAFLSLLGTIALVDLEEHLVLDVLVYPGALLALALAPATAWAAPGALLASWGGALLGGAVGFGVLLAIYLASRGGMGAGDVKLAGLIGLMTGFPGVLVSLFVGFVAGGLVGATLLLLGLRGRKDAIPYGPYLAVGAAVSLLFGTAIIEWYLGLLGWR